jgi:protein-S-isoprenylcysteine O-methyltransferase Ste14
VSITPLIQGLQVMSKIPYSDLFPAAIDPTILSWLFMLGVPLAMLFLVLDKWQWQAAPVLIKVEQHSNQPVKR